MNILMCLFMAVCVLGTGYNLMGIGRHIRSIVSGWKTRKDLMHEMTEREMQTFFRMKAMAKRAKGYRQ